MRSIPDSALQMFAHWFREAGEHKGVTENNAVCLATCSREGRPANRMVLLKSYDETGFVFYTNLESRKGAHLRENPYAAMCFYWEPLGKQVRIEGAVEPVSDEEADAYFASRALKSRIGAWASQQSRPLESRETLLREVAKQSLRFVTEEVPRPPYWSGFRLEPQRMEFWQKGEYRVHDRLCFERQENGEWKEFLLYP